MKTIYLIRHAKSSWNEIGISDFERPLNKRGKRDLPYMADRLKKFKIKPDLILSSPAKRAQKTAKVIAETIGYDKDEISYKESLYESSYTTYRYLLDSLSDDLNSIFIVAHNPTLTDVGERLSGAILTNIPTCSIVCIEFDVESFQDIKEESGKIMFFDYPKKHNIE
ncbi:SixA phosphatase family protein [Sulfurospirillum arcachonense]|uniref:SixA phosphatase family protein n=1 Tax=Sulfurospirillum arcachonense TaxID=57666 RepID=UPI000467F4C8|nr:histidine phosphatase family protein [Sulfurospirillum arcachonense]